MVSKHSSLPSNCIEQLYTCWNTSWSLEAVKRHFWVVPGSFPNHSVAVKFNHKISYFLIFVKLNIDTLFVKNATISSIS
jgi:hypothetical protein